MRCQQARLHYSCVNTIGVMETLRSQAQTPTHNVLFKFAALRSGPTKKEDVVDFCGGNDMGMIIDHSGGGALWMTPHWSEVLLDGLP